MQTQPDSANNMGGPIWSHHFLCVYKAKNVTNGTSKETLQSNHMLIFILKSTTYIFKADPFLLVKNSPYELGYFCTSNDK